MEIGYRHGSRGMWRSLVSTIFLLAGFYVLLAGAFLPPPINYARILALPISIFGILTFLISFYLWLYLWTYFYDLDKHFIRIRKGVLIRHEVSIPYNRIHDVYVEQDALDHVFNLFNISIATASEVSHVKARIRGLNKTNAHAVRDKLLERVRLSGSAVQQDVPKQDENFWRGAK